MATAWYLCPYKRRLPAQKPIRYCAMDDMTQEIVAAGGEWAEAEIDGDQTIVRVRASDQVLSSLALVHRQLSETEARAAWTQTRKAPSYSRASDTVTFRVGVLHPCTPLDSLVGIVPEQPRSRELLGLLGLWTSIGFGLGWRLPFGLCLAMALQGVVPSDMSALERAILFGIRGGVFPTAGVLDDANRADGAMGANWSTDYPNLASSAMRILTNQIAPVSGGGDSNGWWNPGTFGPSSEVFVTLATVGGTGDYAYVAARVVSPDTTGVDGYEMSGTESTGTDERQFWRIDNGAYTQLGATANQEIANGDGMGLEIVGSTLTSYHKPAAGSWTAGTTRTDATYSAAGFIALGLIGSMRLDDFGGGTVAAAGPELKSASDPARSALSDDQRILASVSTVEGD